MPIRQCWGRSAAESAARETIVRLDTVLYCWHWQQARRTTGSRSNGNRPGSSPPNHEGVGMAKGSGGVATAEKLAQSALEHVWIHQATWVDIAEQKGLKVFERGDGARLYD